MKDVKKFNERMSKTKKPVHMSKGGLIKKVAGKKYFDDGGPVVGTAAGAPNGYNLFPQAAPITNPVSTAQLQNASNLANSTIGALQGAGAGETQVGLGELGQTYGALGQIASGAGPNPAQNMLNTATGQNIANTTAALAGQRGAASNPAAAARTAALAGSSAQQGAAGQAATMEAQQQLGAIGAQAGIGSTVLGSGTTNLGNAASAAGTQQGQVLNAEGQYNNSLVGNQQQVGSGIQTLTSLASSASSAIPGLAKLAAYKGGEITHKDHPNYCHGPHDSHVANFMLGGESEKVPAMVSPNEIILTPDQVKRVVENDEDPRNIGHHVPGKDKVKGKNSLENDIVPMDLHEGSVVIPISKVKTMDAEKMRTFVKDAVKPKHMKKVK